jgi:hypothetical protein
MKIIESLNMPKTYNTYIGSAYSILKNANLFEDEYYVFSGMTGMAFHFIMRENMCASAVTVYDWDEEHFLMFDKIGIFSESLFVYKRNGMNTFKKAQEEALKKIKESINKGLGVVTWAPTSILEFGIIKGYDDTDKVYFVSSVEEFDPDPLLYENLGLSEVPYLYIRTFKDNVKVNKEKIFRDSLQYGIYQWNKNFHVSQYFSSGKKAYDIAINSIEKNNIEPFGFSYCIYVYNESKEHIYKYLEYVKENSKYLKGLKISINNYKIISENFKKMTNLVPFGIKEKSEIKDIQAIKNLFEENKKLETEAMEEIEKIIKL